MTDTRTAEILTETTGFSFRDPELLTTVFRHPSFKENGAENNERLVFLGKKLISFILADYVYARFPFTSEDELRERLSEAEKTLSAESFVKENRLQTYILLSKNAEALRESPAVHADIFYALSAAIYKDGGISALKAFVIPKLRSSDETRTPAYRKAPERPISYDSLSDSPAEKEIPEKPASDSGVKEKKPRASLLRTVGLKKKPEESVKTENKRSKEDKATVTEKPDEKKTSPFIRDALTPVRLSDELKKTDRRSQSKKTEPETPISENDNYKSMLQEYVQKNIRTSSVLIKYETKNSGRGTFETSVTLEDKLLAKATGAQKKTTEKEAARLAFKAITSGELAVWFGGLGDAETLSAPKTEDYVSKLNQYFQKKGHTSSTQVVYEKRQSPSKKTFSVAVVTENGELAVGYASSLKEAKQAAAKKACQILGI